MKSLDVDQIAADRSQGLHLSGVFDQFLTELVHTVHRFLMPYGGIGLTLQKEFNDLVTFFR